ncbi:uncharacterized protein ACN427_004140 isoform 2-T2 [Glossina fuscipes fuscipes]
MSTDCGNQRIGDKSIMEDNQSLNETSKLKDSPELCAARSIPCPNFANSTNIKEGLQRGFSHSWPKKKEIKNKERNISRSSKAIV